MQEQQSVQPLAIPSSFEPSGHHPLTEAQIALAKALGDALAERWTQETTVAASEHKMSTTSNP